MERGGRQSLERKKFSTAGRLGGSREGEHRPGGLRGLPSPLLRPPSESGVRVPVWIPPTRSHRLRAVPAALPRLPLGKQGCGLRIRGGGTPFPFWEAGVWWVPGLGRGKMEILERPGHHFSDAISTTASLGDACVALGLLDRCLTDAQMPRNQGSHSPSPPPRYPARLSK